ncbi:MULTISPECIES: phytoene desaturase family protein [Kordiimonas]|jgi:phytoene dehydrogenase-like protein|uniref:phytoene desaturase family protein n=1 Tax=Kordiimonas TaxID=288021 RepID=UPI00257D53B9|nr:FAD-dependent oxidoreductase [Kordiimonas sp. UBA4487]
MTDIKDIQDSGAENPHATKHVVVVGGGMAGLIAALYAAKDGARVTVLEGARQFGGRAQTTNEGGFSVNMGAHALYKDGAAKQALDDLGLTVAGGTPLLEGQTATRQGKSYLLPFSLTSFWRTGLFSLMDRWATTRFYAKLPKMNSADYVGMTLEDTLKALLPAPGARAYMHAVMRLSTYANAPSQMCGGAAIEQLKMALGGVLYLDGGWQQMVDTLVDAAKTSGVDLQAGQKVSDVERTGAGFTVITSKERVSADAVVLALAPKQAASVAAGLAPELTGYAEQAVPVRGACLDVCLSKVPVEATSFALGIDDPVYLSVHSCVAKLAPEGGGLLHTVKYLDPLRAEKASALEQEVESYTDQLQPGWKQHVVSRYFRPGMVIANSLPLAEHGGMAGRPAVETSVPGLCLAGDWVGPKGFLSDASAASGRAAGRLAAGAAAQPQHAQAAE